ncbi:hypothetical protein QWZ13_06985 [Reinekea marina]|nr:hypothetical protein [Reinekea marina]MDN3648656.1 hypothetical protein [Reinekea marina]
MNIAEPCPCLSSTLLRLTLVVNYSSSVLALALVSRHENSV